MVDTEPKIIPVMVPDIGDFDEVEVIEVLVNAPAQGAGISIEALSLSSVIMLSSASIVSPTDTKISIFLWHQTNQTLNIIGMGILIEPQYLNIALSFI
jgi:hypothetical protein